jgi:hypothetical protein
MKWIRVSLALGSCLWTGLLSMSVGACDLTGDGSTPCACPGSSTGSAVIQLLCVPASGPSIQVSGPCTAARVGPLEIDVQSDGADGGACQVELAFAGGVSAEASVTFFAQWEACGEDPHGCGENVVAVPATTTIGSQCGDAGVD